MPFSDHIGPCGATDVNIAQEYTQVTSADRYKRHGHFPGLILVENNPGLAARLERALFDNHFETLLLSGYGISIPDLERQYESFESAGLVVIYSCNKLAPDAKQKLGALAAGRFFDFSAPQLPEEESSSLRKILSKLRNK